jgi:hypothetical protein
MAFHHSPQIVTSGLVMMVDAKNTKSYPGSGTSWTDIVTGKVISADGSPTYNSNGYFSFGAAKRYTRESDDIGITLTNEVTMCCWYRKTGTGGASNQRLIEVFQVSSGPSYGHAILVEDSTGAVSFWLGEGDGSSLDRFIDFAPAGTYADNEWHYLVGTYSLNVASVYVDGNFIDSTTLATTGLIDIENISFGGYTASDTNYFLDGDIAIGQIYNRGLSAQEILQNYNALKGRFGS